LTLDFAFDIIYIIVGIEGDNMSVLVELQKNLVDRPTHMDEFGEYIKNGVYEGSSNKNLICEKTLDRLKDYLKNKTFAVLSAYRVVRSDGTKMPTKEKFQRNRDLRAEFNRRKLGVYNLVGHWAECKVDNVSYKDCPSNMKTDSVERSYLVPNTNMSDEEFTELILKLGTAFDQDAVIIGYKDDAVRPKGIYVIDPDNESIIQTYSTNAWKWDEIANGYSEFFIGLKKATEFMFEGVEIPTSNSGKLVMKSLGILYLI
jgi:hypothetical protein